MWLILKQNRTKGHDSRSFPRWKNIEKNDSHKQMTAQVSYDCFPCLYVACVLPQSDTKVEDIGVRFFKPATDEERHLQAIGSASHMTCLGLDLLYLVTSS